MINLVNKFVYIGIVAFSIIMDYGLNLNETKPKKNIILGTTLPYDHLKDDGVTEIVNWYKKVSTVTLICLIATLAPVLFMSFDYSLYYSFFWITPAIVIMQLPYIFANKKLRKYKRDNGFKGKSEKVADLKLSTAQIKSVSPLYSLIPFAISLIPAIYACFKGHGTEVRDTLLPLLSIPGCIVLVMAIHIVVDRRKKDVVGKDMDINYQLSLTRSRNWSKLYIGMNFILSINALLIGAELLSNDTSPLFSYISVLAVTILTLVFAVYLELDTRRKQQKYTMENSAAANTIIDEDDFWIFGMFYYNTNDKRLMIPNRLGTNTTVNTAKTAGMLLMVISAIVMLSLPAIGGYLIMVDKTPMVVEFSDTAITCTQLKTEYEIPMSEIQDIEYSDVCPDITSKINGFATTNILKGTFKVKDYGKCEVFSPGDRADEFAVVITKDGSTYILGWDKNEN